MQENYNITVYNNDTYEGCNFEVLVNELPLDLTSATIEMQVRINRNTDPVIDIDTASGITITDATAGKFKIDKQVFSAEPDIYEYDIQITLSGGEIKTYIKGRFIIEGDITHE